MFEDPSDVDVVVESPSESLVSGPLVAVEFDVVAISISVVPSVPFPCWVGSKHEGASAFVVSSSQRPTILIRRRPR